jgi:hypothetical protein
VSSAWRLFHYRPSMERAGQPSWPRASCVSDRRIRVVPLLRQAVPDWVQPVTFPPLAPHQLWVVCADLIHHDEHHHVP